MNALKKTLKQPKPQVTLGKAPEKANSVRISLQLLIKNYAQLRWFSCKIADIMKAFLAVLLFASSLFAQDQAAAARAAAGCGPNEVKFTVKTDKAQHPTAQPGAGKAMVYVFGGEAIDLGGLVIGKDGVTTRWGVDGVWVGAGYRNSYFFFPVDPGEHHLCVGRQAFSKPSAALSFTAEAGKTYYFRTRSRHSNTHEHNSGAAETELEPIDPAAAQLLIADSPSTVFQRKESKEPQDSAQTKDQG
jgi:hypothetical protein